MRKSTAIQLNSQGPRQGVLKLAASMKRLPGRSSGSKRAATSEISWLNHAGSMQFEAEKPHEQSDPASIVVHVAILEVA
jgi:hypothetical protein